MDCLWNKIDLRHPPNICWHTFSRDIDAKTFLATINKIIKDLEYLDVLHTEAAILSRLIYRMKSKFRSDKGLKNMEKVNRALLNYLSLSLEKEYKDLKSCIEIRKETITLPSRQMLQYILIRTQGFAKLMCRVESVAQCAGDFFKARIKLGHAWTISVIAYAIISRIWILSRFSIKRSCMWYNNLYGYLKQFKVIGVPLLPERYYLPLDLKVWLDLPWIDEDIRSIPTKEDEGRTIFSLIKARNNDFEEDLTFDVGEIDETLCYPTTVSQVEKFFPKEDLQVSHLTKNNVHSSISQDDIGWRISRETFESDFKTEPLELEKISVAENIKVKENNVDASLIILSKRKREKSQTSIIFKKKDISKKVERKVKSAEDNRKTMKTSKKLKMEETRDIQDHAKTNIDSPAFINTDSLRIQGNYDEDQGEPPKPIKIIISPKEITKKLKRKKAQLVNDCTETRDNLSDFLNEEHNDEVREDWKKKTKTLKVAPKKLKKKTVLRINNVKTKNDLAVFLNAENYSGLDKLQWNMLKKTGQKKLMKLDKCGASDSKKEKLLLENVIQSIKNWIN